MYYLRSTAAADAIKFTLDKSAIQQPEAAVEVAATEAVPVPQPVADDGQQSIPYAQSMTYEQKVADMTCSLDNPEGCEACGS